MELAAYQDAFAAALLSDDAAEHAPAEVARLLRQPGFAVYRNTVMKACIDALHANYPTIVRLVGDEWFRAAAAVFVRRHLPTRASLLFYGEAFPAFLASFEPAQRIPYLAAVSHVDRWWTESHAAADALPLDAARLAALSPSAMATHALTVHPATRWGWTDAWPIHALWAINREDGPVETGDLDWVGEGVLVTRAAATVEVEALSRAGVALLDACAMGISVEAAVASALEAQTDVDIAALIHQLLRAAAFSGLHSV